MGVTYFSVSALWVGAIFGFLTSSNCTSSATCKLTRSLGLCIRDAVADPEFRGPLGVAGVHKETLRSPQLGAPCFRRGEHVVSPLQAPLKGIPGEEESRKPRDL